MGNVQTLTYFLRFLNIRCAEMLFVRHEVAPIEAVSVGTNLELRTMFVIQLKRQHIQKYDVIKVTPEFYCLAAFASCYSSQACEAHACVLTLQVWHLLASKRCGHNDADTRFTVEV